MGAFEMTLSREITSVLVDPHWLAEHLTDTGVRVVEVDVSAAAYDEGHIGGAVLWNVYRDLKDSGYRLIDKPAIEDLLARSAITADSTVICYGYAPALAFWLLKLYGHADVRILDCSRASWRDGGGAWTRTAATSASSRYRLDGTNVDLRADMFHVRAAIGDPASTIVDVRSAGEYLGERFWPSGAAEETGRAGHVPTAVHVPIEDIYHAEGSLRSTDELRRIFAAVDATDNREVIVYCAIGARAAMAWFVLTYLLGRRHVRVYDGSWAEWGHHPGAPVD
jgi:thiosulfate/3-mercaptopyruvate sulfurtransferase